jgi:Bacterial Ig domain/Malectin domain/Viral BACON domain
MNARVFRSALIGVLFVASGVSRLSVSAGENTPPNAYDQTTAVVTGEKRTIPLSCFDPDVAGELKLQIVTPPAHGTLTVLEPFLDLALCQYVPASGYVGQDSFSWRVNDGLANSRTATCTITVRANTPPVAQAQVVGAIKCAWRKSVELKFTDPDNGQPFAATITTLPSQGKLEWSDGASWHEVEAGIAFPYSAGTLTYTPSGPFTGTDSFRWKISDGLATSTETVCSVTVLNFNYTPILSPVLIYKTSDVVVAGSVRQARVSIRFTDHDTDINTSGMSKVLGEQLRRVIAVTAPAHGKLEYRDSLGGWQPIAQGVGVLNKDWYYTPDPGYTGTDSFAVKVNDGVADSNTSTCSFNVNSNNSPVASNQVVTVAEGGKCSFSLGCSDADWQQPLMTTAVTLPSHGKLEHQDASSGDWAPVKTGVGLATKFWRYVPDAGYTGPDTFTWKCSDGVADSSVATCSITVAANNAPTALDQSRTMVASVVRAQTGLRHTDQDAGQPFTFTVVTLPVHGWLESPAGSILRAGDVVSSSTWYYTALPGSAVTADSFTWKMNDGFQDSNTATCSLTMTANTAPALEDSKLVVVGAEGVELRPYPSRCDVDSGQSLVVQIVSGPSHGSIVVKGTKYWDGRISFDRMQYTPAAGYSGPDSFTYRVSDRNGESNVATYRLLVRATQRDRAGMLVALVVNDLLHPEIQADIERLKADLEAEGYTAKIKAWNAATLGAKDLWDYLGNEYKAPDQFLAGAILIGNIPRASGSNDVVYWNMESYGDTSKAHIWVSRMWALSGSGGGLFAGDEVTLLKRALQANHDYRTGTARLPHNAYHFVDAGLMASGVVSNAFEAWPQTEVLQPRYAWLKSGNLLHQTTHGGPSSYDSGQVSTLTIHDMLAQIPFALSGSCSAGALGGVVNNQLFTRGGGNVLSVGATAVTGDGYYSILGNSTSDREHVRNLAAGESWGAAYVKSRNFDKARSVFYGDLSLPILVAPANEMPLITATADATVGNAPLSVSFTATASDSDGVIALYEWFPEGHQQGKIEPALTGPAATTSTYLYTKPHRYLARAQVVDNYKARSFKNVEVVVGPEPGKPLRVNCGRVQNAWNGLSKHYVAGYDYTDTSGQLWLHDQTFAVGTWGCTSIDGNKARTFSGDVMGTDDDYIYLYHYLDYHRSGFTYKVPVANGDYIVKFGFTDMANTEAGKRLIDLSLEDVLVESAFDIVATGGPKTPVTVTKTVTVSDGELVLKVITNAASPTDGNNNKAILNCFEVIPLGGDNTPPTISNIADQATDEDTAKGPIAFTVGDAETAVGDLTLTKSSSNTALVPTANIVFGGSGSDRTVTITPAADQSGTATITVTVTDGGGLTAADSFTLTVNAVNDAPVADAQSVTTPEDAAKAIKLTADDVEADALSWHIVSAPAHGALSGTAPNLTYTPAADDNGADSFTFKVNDGTVDSNVATVSITVTPVNDAPTADAQSVTTAEDTAKAITLTGSDPEGDALTYHVMAGPAHGTLSGTGANRTYTPDPSYSGADSFTFKVNDGTVDSTLATVSITVTAVNDAPTADAQSVTTAEDTSKAITLTANDSDGDALSWHIVAAPAHGTLSGTAPNLTYTPAADYNGADSFTFKVNDGTVDSNIATVSITVTAVNDLPTADAQSVTTAEDVAKAITLTGSDPEGSALTYIIVASPAHGTLTGTGASRSYTPDLDYNGADSFTFKVNDGADDSNVATVSITVTAVNDAPVISTAQPGTPFTVAAGSTQVFEVWPHDPDADTLSYSWKIDGAGTADADSDLSYSPVDADAGDHTITVTVSDGKGGTDSHTWNVKVTCLSPVIALSTAGLTPSCVQGSSPADDIFNIWNSGGGTLSYATSDNVPWISLSPSSGSSTGEKDPVAVHYSTNGMAAGVYNATITITVGGATNSPQTISVTLTIGAQPTISLSPTSLSPSCVEAASPADESFEVWNSGGSTLSYSIGDNAAWLSCTPTSGTSTGEKDVITVKYSTAALAPGVYNATISISAAGASNSPQTVSVTLTVNALPPPQPAIATSITSLSNTCKKKSDAAAQSFMLWNSGGGTLSYSISDDAAWLSCSPATGTSTGEKDTVTVSYSTSSLAVGTYTATITITAPGASNTPQTVPVTLIVTPGKSSKSAKDSKTDAEGPGSGGSGGCSMSPAAGADPVTWALPYLAMLATCLFGRLRRRKKGTK